MGRRDRRTPGISSGPVSMAQRWAKTLPETTSKVLLWPLHRFMCVHRCIICTRSSKHIQNTKKLWGDGVKKLNVVIHKSFSATYRVEASMGYKRHPGSIKQNKTTKNSKPNKPYLLGNYKELQLLPPLPRFETRAKGSFISGLSRITGMQPMLGLCCYWN